MLTVCQGTDLTRWQDGQRVEVTPEVEAEALAKLATCGSTGSTAAPPGELPGRALVTERAAAVELRLAGLEVKPGSLAEARGLPNIPRIRHPLG